MRVRALYRRNHGGFLTGWFLARLQEDATEMIGLADERGDGVIHKDEFVNFITSYVTNASNTQSPARASSIHSKSPQVGPSLARRASEHLEIRDIWGDISSPASRRPSGGVGPVS